MDPRPAPLHPAARPARWATALRLLLPLTVVLLLLAAVLGGLAGAARWMLATEAGTRWLLAALPGVQAEGVRGALLGADFSADRLQITWNRGRAPADIEGLELRGVAWRWRPESELWIALEIATARARRVTIDTGPPSPDPIAAPSALVAPLMVRVARTEVAELRLNEFEPIAALAVSGLEFDGRPGQRHTIEQFVLRGYGLALGGQASIGNGAPLPLEASLTLTPTLHAGDDAPPWAAVLRASGPLTALDVTAVLRGVPRAGAAAPQAELEARVRPLDAWPVTTLVARTEALDLSALAAGAPQTRLGGRIDANTPQRDAPITARGQIENRLPGRWNEGRLPFTRLDFELSGTLERRDRIEMPRLELQLADAAGPAGRLSGRADWTGDRLELELALAAVVPQRLDSRAPAMTLTGPLKASLRGLPSPDPAAAGPRPPWTAQARLELEGRFAGAPTAVRLSAEGSAAADRIELRGLRAQAGAAVAELQAVLTRSSARAPWQLQTSGRVDDFDPVPWWPGEVGSAWRRGPHRLDADWKFDLRLPPAAARPTTLAWAQRLAGNGQLRVHDSVLAGVPLAAQIGLGYAQAGMPNPGSLRADLTLGGNRVLLEGEGDPAGSGASDRWRAEVQAPALAALAPLARLHPALAAWIPREGSVSANVAAQGRWPVLATDGQLRIEQLRAGALAVNRGAARWNLRLGQDDDAPLTLAASASGVQLGAQRAELLRADLSGTLAQHRIDLHAALPYLPPALAEQLLGLRVQRGTRAELRALGRWQSEAEGGSWRAGIERIAVGPWDGQVDLTATPLGTAWAEAKDLQAELGFDREGTLRTLRAEPGRVQLAQGIALRWDAVQADLRGERAQFALRADVEAFPIAPLLARAQPDMGWQGDLRLAARVVLKADERFEADVVLERQDGDLHLGNLDGVQLFGLTEFRLALTARDGVWDFSPRLTGRSLGEIRGSLRARTTPDRRWPDADAQIEGQVQAHVADLGIWSNWVPPGWRLAGELRTTATVGGRFGAPTYTGELTGSDLAVRHLLQGVNVRDGQLRVVLAGESAQIERFSARAGEGRVDITGGAQFGERPNARLVLEAERFRVLGRVDRQLTASGRAELALGRDGGRLDGRFRVDEGLFDFSSADAPSLDDDVNVRAGDDADGNGDAAAAQRPRRNFVLGVDLDLGQQLRVRGRGIDTGLAGQLRITNPGGRLAMNGTIRTEGGTYAAYGQKLEIERGLIAFSGPLSDPRLDVLALRPNLDVQVGVQITGTAQLPRVRLYADPDMSDSDKLSWLLLGRAPEGLGKDDAALLQRASFALLAGEGGAPTDALLKNLGLDELSVRPGDSDTRETVFALGKQLSRRWYVGYERGVNSTTGTWQLIYRVAQRLTVRAQSGEDNSLDVIWIWRVHEAPSEGGVRKSLPAMPP